MARPTKKGLSYFPLDASIFNNRKIRRLIRGEGLAGFAIWQYLLCQIYSNGYCITADQDFIFDASEDLRVDEKIITKLITSAITHGLFSPHLYSELRVLSSKAIQEQYIKICVDAKRKFTPIESTLNLIPVQDEAPPLLDNSEETPDNSEETPVNSEETPEKKEESTQRKEKERKEKERKVKEIISPAQFGKVIAKIIVKDRPYILTADESEAAEALLIALVSALVSRKESPTLENTVNLFCLLYESLSEIDRQNFTLVYLTKHLNRIFGGLKLYMRKQSRR